MLAQPGFAQFSSAIFDELAENASRVSQVVSGQRLWERVFTSAQRTELGGDFWTAYSKPMERSACAQKLHSGSEQRAIIESGFALGFLRDFDRHRLIEEIGESTPQNTDKRVPQWNAATGKLFWENRLVRKLRILKKPSNIQIILNAFEAAGWPERIPNPVRPGLAPPVQVHETLRSLNKNLKAIRFHSQEGAGAIHWSSEH